MKHVLHEVNGETKFTFMEIQDATNEVHVYEYPGCYLMFKSHYIQPTTSVLHMLIFKTANYRFMELPNYKADINLRKLARFVLHCEEKLWARRQTQRKA